MAQLQAYREKRDFRATPEPRGRASRKAGSRFVVQKHDARRLHYDFRLELDGVLKSWAVTRGPSLVPGDKRLAVHVEDHPLDYGGFEGTIPKGEYGGGTVLLWDQGHWAPIGDPHKGLAKGHLEFDLKGEKLTGRWHLIRMAHRPRDKHENWLLIKGEDAAARPPEAPDILEERPESVKTGRMVGEIAGEEPGWSSRTGRIRKGTRKAEPGEPEPGKADKGRADKGKARAEPPAPVPDPGSVKGARKAALPAFVEPELASLAEKPPEGARWLHEIKFDGYRLQARIEAGRVRLSTRGGLDWTKKFGREVVTGLRDLPVGTALLDGELVSESGSGASEFSLLQADLSEGRTDRFVYYAFDLLYLDGFDLRGAPLVERKRLLKAVIGQRPGPVRFSTDFEAEGAVVLRHACKMGLEGVVSKLRDGSYRSGRTKNWLKAKCSAHQEFVIGGYVPSTTSRRAIGSLVLGVYDKGELSHVGRVGTGFSMAVAEDLFAELQRLRVGTSPFAGRLTTEEARQVRYVRPERVAEVEFRDWTADGHVRQASFRGLREDKEPKDVVRESLKRTARMAAAPARSVQLTHPDRVYWPDAGVTKQGLADYYADAWRFISPFITERPLALLRGPEGIAGQTFFQKHAWKGLNPHIDLVRDPKDKAGEPLISIHDLDGLMALVQSGVLEIHPWGSTTADWEHPDMIIMDLDPGDGIVWDDVVAAARETRERLERAGLTAFVKTSGGKGLHVVAPLRPKAAWPAVKAFTKAIADGMAADDPRRYVSTITKAKRQGRILIDYLRNQRGTTAVAPYSTRARPGAPVSMPLAWDELGSVIGAAYFTVENAPKRLAATTDDPWSSFRAAAAPLETPRGRKAA
jgi:bifunctional non-homologous end joining protein LigD